MRAWPLVLVALSLASGAGVAHADSEQAFSVGAGYATFSAPGEKMGEMEAPQVSPTLGGVLVVSYERAVGSDVALRAEVAGGMFYGGNSDQQSARSYALLADAGAAFRFDVFKYVPYAFAGLGVVTAGGGPIEGAGTSFVLVAGGGLDRLWSRKRSGGIELRVASFGGDITVVTIGVRGTVRWGFF
jgi:hypothetical protein